MNRRNNLRNASHLVATVSAFLTVGLYARDTKKSRLHDKNFSRAAENPINIGLQSLCDDLGGAEGHGFNRAARKPQK